MLFSSAIFLFAFLPVLYIVYRLVPGIRGKNVVLLLFSLLFYCFGSLAHLLALLLRRLAAPGIVLCHRRNDHGGRKDCGRQNCCKNLFHCGILHFYLLSVPASVSRHARFNPSFRIVAGRSFND